VFENRVLKRIFGPRRDEVMGKWRKLHNEELHNLYSSPNIIRMIKSRRMRNAYRIFVGKPEGKRPLGRLLPSLLVSAAAARCCYSACLGCST
jgi:hypothetical protein